VGAYGVGNNIPVGWSNFSAVLVTRYLCASCGFSEEWVDDKAGLEKLSAKYNPEPDTATTARSCPAQGSLGSAMLLRDDHGGHLESASTCTAGRSKDGGPRTQRGGQRGDDGTVASLQKQAVRRQTS